MEHAYVIASLQSYYSPPCEPQSSYGDTTALAPFPLHHSQSSFNL